MQEIETYFHLSVEYNIPHSFFILLQHGIVKKNVIF